MVVNTKRSIASILKEADDAGTDSGKVAVLKHNDSDVLRMLLRLSYDRNVRWLLPYGAPPYRATDAANDVQGRLYSEIKKFYLFVEGGNPPPPQLQPSKRESLFIQLLERIDPDDSRLLILIKDRELTKVYKSLIPRIINQAFPGLIEIKEEKGKEIGQNE